MKTIKILRSVAGRMPDGLPFKYGKGQVVTVRDDIADDLCRNNVNAILVEPSAPAERRESTDVKPKEKRKKGND